MEVVMRRHRFRAVAPGLVVLVVLVWAASAFAEKVASYSADMVSLDATGKVEAATRIYVDAGRMRLELPPQEGMQGMTIIVRPDLKLQWMVDAESRTCLEHALDDDQLRAIAPAMAAATPDSREERLGTETVQGYKAEKKRVTTTQKVMGQVVRTVSLVWQAEEFDIPLRERDEEGFTEELRNIKVGAQPASLFEVPPGYRVVKGKVGQMPPGMMPQGMLPEGMSPDAMQLPEGMTLPEGMIPSGLMPAKPSGGKTQ